MIPTFKAMAIISVERLGMKTPAAEFARRFL
jgi:hypothetical protein